MGDAEAIIKQQIQLSERFRVDLLVLKVSANERFPDGIKARFVLVDVLDRIPRVLIDNHQPYGFHSHTGLPEDKTKREKLETTDYKEALKVFWGLVWEIIENED